MNQTIQQQLYEKYLGTNWKTQKSLGKVGTNTPMQVVNVVNKNHKNYLLFDNGEQLNVDFINEFLIPAEQAMGIGGDPSGENKVMPSIDNYEYPKSRNQFNQEKGITPDLQPGKKGPSITAPGITTTPPKNKKQEKKPDDIFKMFDLVERDLNLKLKIKLPEKSLLKMMFKNATDSAEFLDSLSKYVLNNINEDAINDSLIKELGGNQIPTKKPTDSSNKPKIIEDPDNKKNDKKDE
jgi:hypothetical protein